MGGCSELRSSLEETGSSEWGGFSLAEPLPGGRAASPLPPGVVAWYPGSRLSLSLPAGPEVNEEW